MLIKVQNHPNFPSTCFIFLFYSIILFLSFISLVTVIHFPGNKLLLLSYSLLIILSFSAIRLGRFSYFYLFINVLFILGFWLKICTFFNFHLNFLEPTGLFDYSIEAWNKVLWILNFAQLGLLLAQILSFCCFFKTTDAFSIPSIPTFYKKYSLFIWLGFLALSFLVILMNIKFNLYRSGFIPTIQLPFKLSAIIAWAMNIGFSFIFCLFMWWDLHLNRHLLRNYGFIALAAIGFSAGCMSRGLYVYQAGHYFFSFLKTRLLNAKTAYIILSLFLMIFMLGSFINFKLVMYQRNLYYPHQLLPKMIKESLEKERLIKEQANKEEISNHVVKPVNFDAACEKYINDPNIKIDNITITNKDCLLFLAHSPRSNHFLFNHTYLTLALQRWIGLEGLMAISAWPYLNTSTFMAGWTNRLAPHTANPYPDISNAVYFQKSYPMKEKFFFSSLPGATGMLYYSGHVVVVLGGIFFLIFIGISGEFFLHSMLQNPFCESFYGIYLAFLLTMLGDAHILAAQFSEIIITILLIKLFLFLTKKDLK